jgi:hypothetical protein
MAVVRSSAAIGKFNTFPHRHHDKLDVVFRLVNNHFGVQPGTGRNSALSAPSCTVQVAVFCNRSKGKIIQPAASNPVRRTKQSGPLNPANGMKCPYLTNLKQTSA